MTTRASGGNKVTLWQQGNAVATRKGGGYKENAVATRASGGNKKTRWQRGQAVATRKAKEDESDGAVWGRCRST